jgi:raffinose/stachyose/melibiose transport system permease protein
MAFPALVVYSFVVIVPSIRGALFAFTKWNGDTLTAPWVGLRNFRRLASDPIAIGAIENTILLAVVITVGQTVLGLLLALGMNQRLRTRSALRTAFFLPVILTPVVTGYIWSYLLAPHGAVNDALHSVGLSGLEFDWLGDRRTALWSVAVVIVWQYVGFSMVIFLAGLQAVPREIVEAAMVDGAGAFRRFISVTLPLINGALVINTVLTLIAGLSQFDLVYIMTGGGPAGTSDTLSLAIVKTGFQLGDYSFGTAMSLVAAAIIGVVAALQYIVLSRRVSQ